MPIKIEPKGGFFETDSDGFIVNDCHWDNIPLNWVPAVEDVIRSYRHTHGTNLNSVYLRGSVPRGTMINSISDIDSFCLTHKDPVEQSEALLSLYQAEFKKKFAFINGIEIEAYSVHYALRTRSMRFLLKTQSLCVAGDDVSEEIDPMPISNDALDSCIYLDMVNESFLEQCEKSCSEDDAMDLCVWIFKFALRAAFEVVMFREKRYTRDIYYCWSSYAKYYPQHSEKLKRALHFVVNPMADLWETKLVWRSIFEVLKEHVQRDEHTLLHSPLSDSKS